METIDYLRKPWWEDRTFASGIARDRYVVRLAEAQSRRQIEVLVGGRRVKPLSGLRLFLRRFPQSDGAILVTRSVSATLEDFHGVRLEAIPLWRFLLKV